MDYFYYSSIVQKSGEEENVTEKPRHIFANLPEVVIGLIFSYHEKKTLSAIAMQGSGKNYEKYLREKEKLFKRRMKSLEYFPPIKIKMCFKARYFYFRSWFEMGNMLFNDEGLFIEDDDNDYF